MSDAPLPPAATPPPPDLPLARTRRPRLPLIWLVPLIAAFIAGFLAWRDWLQQGYLITLSFSTASGLTAGVTQVRHKSVALGTVRDIELSHDMSHVIVHVRMTRDATPILTDHAQFWVVRPRFSAGYISGLETLVSGAYIDVDPGAPGGRRKTDFKGLEEPPPVRSDEAGRSYVLTSSEVGGLGSGSPVLYRGVNAGEVLSYNVGAEDTPATVHIFIRAPYDQYVHADSRFWKDTGVKVSYGAQGLHVELDSLQTALAGGIAFSTPSDAATAAPAPNGAAFTLYADQDQAVDSSYRQKVPLVAYFQGSVQGLGPGSAVDLFGLDIGRVTAVTPEIDRAQPRVRVDMEIEPRRIFADADTSWRNPLQVMQHLIAGGLRAELTTRSVITGQEAVSLEFVAGASPAQAALEGPAIVVPSRGGGGNLMDAVSAVADELNRVPLAQIAENLNQLLANANHTIGSPDMRASIKTLSTTLQQLQTLVRQTNTGLTPALRRLPAISDQLQQAMTHANQVLAGLGNNYGANSDFHRDLRQLMDQASDAARSVRMLADFLDRHPEALLRGRGAGP